MTFRNGLKAGDNSDAALFGKLGLSAVAGEESMRACAVETVE